MTLYLQLLFNLCGCSFEVVGILLRPSCCSKVVSSSLATTPRLSLGGVWSIVTIFPCLSRCKDTFLHLAVEMGQRHPAEPQKQPTRAVTRGSPEQRWVRALWDAQRSRGERRFPTVQVCWVHFDIGWLVWNHLTARSWQQRCPERHSFVPNKTCDTQRSATFYEMHSLLLAHVNTLATESFKSQANAARYRDWKPIYSKMYKQTSQTGTGWDVLCWRSVPETFLEVKQQVKKVNGE